MTPIFNKAPAGVAILLFAAFALFGSPQAAQADDAEAAKTLVAGLVNETAQTFSGQTMANEERNAKLKAMIAKYGDVTISSQDVLGHYWAKATEGQRTSFVALVVDYAIGSWAQQLSNLPAGQHFEITTTEATENGHIIIHSLAISPNDTSPVDWVVTRNAEGRLIVIDAAVEGASVIQTMHGDFTAIIRANSGKVEALLEAIRAKIASYTAS